MSPAPFVPTTYDDCLGCRKGDVISDSQLSQSAEVELLLLMLKTSKAKFSYRPSITPYKQRRQRKWMRDTMPSMRFTPFSDLASGD